MALAVKTKRGEDMSKKAEKKEVKSPNNEDMIKQLQEQVTYHHTLFLKSQGALALLIGLESSKEN